MTPTQKAEQRTKLEELEALARAATPGPWKREDMDVFVGEMDFVAILSADEIPWRFEQCEKNAAFIAAIPKILNTGKG